MKRLKLICTFILLGLELTVKVPRLYASENLSASSEGLELPLYKRPIQKSSTRGNDSKTTQRGTKDSPLFIDVISPTKTAAESAQEQKEREEKLSLDRKTVTLNERTVELNSEVARFTAYLAGLALLQFLVLIAQAWFNYRQTSHQRIIERAYVFAKVTTLDHTNQDPIYGKTSVLGATVKFINYGKTPAIVRLTQGKLTLTTTIPDKLPHDVETQHWQEGFTIAPGKSMTSHVTLPMPNDSLASMLEKNGFSLYCIGVIHYRDIFGNPGHTSFCWRYNMNTNAFRFVTDNPLNYCK